MKDYSEKLFKELQEELLLYAEMGILPVRRLANSLSCISVTMDKLKQHVKEEGFKTNSEEIEFFKYDKTRYICEQIFALEIFSITNNKPLKDKQKIKKFYEKELQFVSRFFDQYQFLYQYYKFDFKELDNLLFLRGVKPSDIILPETAGLDNDFSSNCDFLFGKFKAYERLQLFLLEELKSLGNSHQNPAGVNASGKAIKWTGETINLAELAYGIWLTGQINNGNANATQIFEHLEQCFQVKIGTAFRRWQSISKRKRVGPTKYMDEMRGAIEKRLDEENGLNR